MRTIANVLLAALALVGCSAPRGSGEQWFKEGATAQDRDKALDECERETRATAGAAGRGNLASEAKPFNDRCMRAHGWVLK
jgi:hypothetical protein